MQSLELEQILMIQKILWSSFILFTVSTVVLFILNIFMAERVKVSVGKQAKKEKITFSSEDVSLPSSEETSEKTSSPKPHTSSKLTETKDSTKDTPSKSSRSSIFDLKDL